MDQMNEKAGNSDECPEVMQHHDELLHPVEKSKIEMSSAYAVNGNDPVAKMPLEQDQTSTLTNLDNNDIVSTAKDVSPGNSYSDLQIVSVSSKSADFTVAPPIDFDSVIDLPVEETMAFDELQDSYVPLDGNTEKIPVADIPVVENTDVLDAVGLHAKPVEKNIDILKSVENTEPGHSESNAISKSTGSKSVSECTDVMTESKLPHDGTADLLKSINTSIIGNIEVLNTTSSPVDKDVEALEVTGVPVVEDTSETEVLKFVNTPVESADVSDMDVPIISQVCGNATIVPSENTQLNLQDKDLITSDDNIPSETDKSAFINKDTSLVDEEDKQNIETESHFRNEEKSASNAGDDKLPVVTPSFEEIPVIVKTEPQDIYMKDDENSDTHYEKQSESKGAETSLISDLNIDFNYCASCNLDFRSNSSEAPRKLRLFSSFNSVSGDIRTVSTLEALLLIFDLRFVKCCTAFHKEEELLQDISLCTQCAIMATQMYKLYTEFSELIHAESILSKLVNHENVLQNNAIAKASAAKTHLETEGNVKSQDPMENLPNIRVRNPSEKQRKGVKSIFESDNESEGESREVINGLESVRRNSLEIRKKNNIERNRRTSVSSDKSAISLNRSVSSMSPRSVKPIHLRIKKEHGRLPLPVINNIHTKIQMLQSQQRPKRIFDVKQESMVIQPLRKMSRGNSTDSVPNIISVHSIGIPSIVKDEAQQCSSSSLQRSLRPKRTSCKKVDYSKQLLAESEEEEEDDKDKDKDAEIFSEDEFDDDPQDDPDFSRKPKSKAHQLFKGAKKSKTKLSPVDIKRMFDSERLLKELSLPNLFPLTCKICKKTFRDVVSLERHKKTHKTNTTISSFPCFLCGIVCWSNNVFLTHLNTHIPEKPFVCDCCNAAFKLKGELDQHKLRHQDLIIFTCQQCKECFPSLMLLNRHEAAIHMKETSYICPMCPAVQFERSDWSKHILTHAPFKCTKCDLFFNPNDLKIHVQTFHTAAATTQKLQQPQLQSQSIFSDLLRAASQRINH